ncbi:GNAT family N-acetyltransferase [Aquimixticola soesokkakensis]|nr:GNAT family N-acetyltransferase [Aquimixticola soesokkakensis]
MSEQIEITVHTALDQIGQADWDACAAPELADGGRPHDPFTTYRFLHALEVSGSVGGDSGWMPRYLAARQGGVLIGVAPLYAKGHSQGEYVFDHAWAQAWDRAGGRYYPKLQVAVPFTPASGRRLLVKSEHAQVAQSALVQGMVQLAAENHLSSLHLTFCTEAEADAGAQMGLMRRLGQQFHWHNHDYADFDAFLADLAARKRKAIKRERRSAAAFDAEGQIVTLTGDQIRPEHWDAFWMFYQDTGARKWGAPYLTRAFFDVVQERMREDVALVLALRGGVPVAGALNFIGRDVLYGRYWGCVEDHPFLHFELCYYRAIDFAIAHRLSRVEAGAQGEHKLARGYLPTATHSLHWIADPDFAQAVQNFCDAERVAVGEEVDILTSYGPFKHTGDEDVQA